MVRSSGGQRESDGVVVPVGGGQSPVGKGPDFCQVSGVGRHRGMAGPPGPIILMANLGLSCCSWSAPSPTRGLHNHAEKTVGKPYAGKPHARIDRGMGKQDRYAAPDNPDHQWPFRVA